MPGGPNEFPEMLKTRPITQNNPILTVQQVSGNKIAPLLLVMYMLLSGIFSCSAARGSSHAAAGSSHLLRARRRARARPAAASPPPALDAHTGVCGKTLLLRQPLPCNPAAETALQPLIWCLESSFVFVSSSPEGWFFTDTGIARIPGDVRPGRGGQVASVLGVLAGSDIINN